MTLMWLFLWLLNGALALWNLVLWSDTGFVGNLIAGIVSGLVGLYCFVMVTSSISDRK